MKNDPSEMNNIYGKPGTEEITKNLMAELEKLETQYNAPKAR